MIRSLAVGALVIGVLTAQVPSPTPPPSPPPLATASPSASPSPETSPSPSASATPASVVIAAAPATVAMPPGGFVDVTISNASGDVATAFDKNLATATVDQATHVVRVSAGTATGTDVMHVTDPSGAQVDVPVRIAPYGGTLAQSLTLDVTGTPADGDWVAAQIRDLLRRSTLVQPGAQATYTVAPLAVPLASGARTSVSVPVQIAGGENYLDVAGTTVVNVQNMTLDPFTPSVLLYDDDPEKIVGDGPLFHATIQPDQPVRLYYYHDSDAAQHRIVMFLSATTAEPTPVHVVAATGGPNVDVMTVGHNVSRNYVLSKLHNQGVVIDLAQDRGDYSFLDVVFGGGAGIAGSVDLRVLGGGPVAVAILAVPVGADADTIAQIALQAPLAKDGHQRSGIFKLDGDYGNAYKNYVAGGPDVSLVYGDQGPPGADADAGRDAGDYGVLQTIAFSLNNPTAKPAVAYLYERPIGGIVRSTFFLNGTPVEMGCVRDSTQRYQVSTYALAPGATVPVTVTTMTDGGSNYPIEIGVSATPPVPVTPAIDAPDGCFPKAATPSPAPVESPTGEPSPEPSATPEGLMKI